MSRTVVTPIPSPPPPKPPQKPMLPPPIIKKKKKADQHPKPLFSSSMRVKVERKELHIMKNKSGFGKGARNESLHWALKALERELEPQREGGGGGDGEFSRGMVGLAAAVGLFHGLSAQDREELHPWLVWFSMAFVLSFRYI